jgi:hypothetical protein
MIAWAHHIGMVHERRPKALAFHTRRTRVEWESRCLRRVATGWLALRSAAAAPEKRITHGRYNRCCALLDNALSHCLDHERRSGLLCGRSLRLASCYLPATLAVELLGSD